jgi:hypothetical protein
MGRLVSIIVVIWLVIGLVAAFQRGYITHDNNVKCRTVADTLVTVVAGPLNYMGVNSKVSCHVPQPSK